jgi:hypothetical protein
VYWTKPYLELVLKLFEIVPAEAMYIEAIHIQMYSRLATMPASDSTRLIDQRNPLGL